jgi:DNA-binding IclR family transcriptional regulator
MIQFGLLLLDFVINEYRPGTTETTGSGDVVFPAVLSTDVAVYIVNAICGSTPSRMESMVLGEIPIWHTPSMELQ